MEKERNSGLKLTPQRLAILRYLDCNKEHPSAADVYRAVSKEFPTMSLATVYNTLKRLKKKENILELSIDPDKKRFDPNTDNHNHLICVFCKKIVDIHYGFDITLPETETRDFELLGNHIDFYGICPECKELKGYTEH
jgi:Fur family peroxide stress response transcriptional regulator